MSSYRIVFQFKLIAETEASRACGIIKPFSARAWNYFLKHIYRFTYRWVLEILYHQAYDIVDECFRDQIHSPLLSRNRKFCRTKPRSGCCGCWSANLLSLIYNCERFIHIYVKSLQWGILFARFAVFKVLVRHLLIINLAYLAFRVEEKIGGVTGRRTEIYEENERNKFHDGCRRRTMM